MGYQAIPLASELYHVIQQYLDIIWPYFFDDFPENRIGLLLLPGRNGATPKNVGAAFAGVFQAYGGAYITPATLRKIVETAMEGSNFFTKEERERMSKGLLHDYKTAQSYYVLPDTEKEHSNILNRYRQFCDSITQGPLSTTMLLPQQIFPGLSPELVQSPSSSPSVSLQTDTGFPPSDLSSSPSKYSPPHSHLSPNNPYSSSSPHSIQGHENYSFPPPASSSLTLPNSILTNSSVSRLANDEMALQFAHNGNSIREIYVCIGMEVHIVEYDFDSKWCEILRVLGCNEYRIMTIEGRIVLPSSYVRNCSCNKIVLEK
jgi:hypothetical protein